MDTMITSQESPRPYFRPTTASQRRLLFRTVEETGNVSEAARRTHVGRGTYYHWRSRYESEGVAGLATERSRAPHHTRIPPVSAELREEVLTFYCEHSDERGYRTIANRLRQAHAGQKVISHSKVGEIIKTALAPAPPSLAPAPAEPSAEEAAPETGVVHAPRPNQTLNVDLCVVPLTHAGTEELMSVSFNAAAAGITLTPDDLGLVADATMTPSDPAAAPATFPGQAFADATQPYEEQMRAYVEQRTAKRAAKGQRKQRRRQKQAERAELNAQSAEVRLKRRRQRLQRRPEDAAWQAQRQAHRQAEQAWRQTAKAERRARRAERQAQRAQWQADKAARRTQREQRQAEDAAWRQARQTLRTQLAQLTVAAPVVTAWLAILVVVDNGTRRCLGLPLFTEGIHVTAELIVAALRALCPPELRFIISDNGPQFIAQAFAQFAQAQAFIHVRIAPHRPCTNGIAERFVRTLKEWLETHTWNSPEELRALLAEFIEYYNHRPHQGAELGGLSPNEFIRQLASCSTC